MIVLKFTRWSHFLKTMVNHFPCVLNWKEITEQDRELIILVIQGSSLVAWFVYCWAVKYAFQSKIKCRIKPTWPTSVSEPGTRNNSKRFEIIAAVRTQDCHTINQMINNEVFPTSKVSLHIISYLIFSA